MSEYTLTVIDTSAIQNYIFSSNSLQHNIGASGLVHYATNDWVFEELVKMDMTNIDFNHEFNEKTIENDAFAYILKEYGTTYTNFFY